uniref:NACHT domain-containing protein n=1 Tax=Anabas testudineus TaxID=64144 RepID=A0A3Q1HSX6_ANATE
MVDWAKGNSNKDVELIVSLNFRDLNSRRDEVQSMKDFVNHCLDNLTQAEVWNNRKCKLFFILDDLEECELPLNFEENKDLVDLKEAASMDVLLTNLIKGKLLPSDHLWIISGPSGVNKIPSEYIHKVTQCQEKNAVQTLTADLKKEVLNKYEEELSGCETHTEIYDIEEISKDKQKLTQTTYENILQSKGKKVRTVLTKGVCGIGKTFHTQKFMVDWAKGNSNKDVDLIVSLNFRDLNSRRDEVQSMKDFVNHCLDDDKQAEVWNNSKCKLVFILDGLEECELPLNFEKNKDLVDLKEAASIDVLLTNLIKGTLLPSDRLWIISGPSAVNKIPSEYIHKVTQCQDKNAVQTLTADLKKDVLNKYEEELSGFETHTEIYDIEEIIKDKQKLTQTTYKNIIQSKKKKVRTVLTKGVSGIGKTFQTQKFMVDWAKENSNKDVDLIVSLNFRDLNSRRDKVQSMKDFVNHCLDDDKQAEVWNNSQCKLVFILDGLEECELPLNFKKNKDLVDLKEAASMDVLLTNLIKGTLLPSDRLWIISRPSGVNKIPSEYIHKVTQCQEKNAVQTLTADLKKEVLNKYEEELSGCETHTEIYDIEEIIKDKQKLTQTTYKNILQSKKKKVRTVLTKGVSGIGKTFQKQKFMVDWAKGNSNKDVDLIVSLNFRDLNSRRDKVQSMKDFVNHCLNDDKQAEVWNNSQCKLVFILDGLEECELPLNFKKNKDLVDLKEAASIDVLLTNLIKGTLLPSDHLWIISRPSGVNKIPSEYIHKVTQCQGKKSL